MNVDNVENGKNDEKSPNDSDRPTRPEAQTTTTEFLKQNILYKVIVFIFWQKFCFM